MNRAFKLKPSTVHEQFGEETVILNLETGTYFSAQEVGGVVWNLVINGHTEKGILREIVAQFAGDKSEISSGTTRFLDQLVEEGLVVSKPTENDPSDRAPASVANKAFIPPLL